MTGPETIVFGNDGTMYTMTDEGSLVSLSEFEEMDDGFTITAKSNVVADLGMGRPLGGRFDAQGTLYLADAHLGLTRLKNPGSGSKVELVATRVFDEEKWTQILYANDVAIGPKTGIVYFTDCKYLAYVTRIIPYQTFHGRTQIFCSCFQYHASN
jgi:sugar lactone lactonase YvrE